MGVAWETLAGAARRQAPARVHAAAPRLHRSAVRSKLSVMAPRILLVNPPIYDFAAYDFWVKPYGLLSVAGQLRGRAEMRLFDYLERETAGAVQAADDSPPARSGPGAPRRDRWGRGKFPCEVVPTPEPLARIPRRYRRYGRPRQSFQDFLRAEAPFDFALIQTGMTYWYLGVQEVIQDIRRLSPRTKIVLGGVYATLCPAHARTLRADLVIAGARLAPLWELLGVAPDPSGLPFWESYGRSKIGVLKLTDGCPFQCTYCCVPRVYPGFAPRRTERVLAELELLCKLGARDVAFYDDALLFEPASAMVPFVAGARRRGLNVNFHTPNALHARLISKDLARLMVGAGFKTFYLGFESTEQSWHARTGQKLTCAEFAKAVETLLDAGADAGQVTAYVLLGHPDTTSRSVEASMRVVHGLGVRVMLSEFSPLPGTPDGERCRAWVDLDEPLLHNKTAFPIILFGNGEVNRLKQLCRELNAARRSAIPGPRLDSRAFPGGAADGLLPSRSTSFQSRT